MRYLLVFFLSLFLTAPAQAEPADINAAARSVVRVVLIGGGEDGEPALIGHGSGVAVAPDVILTNSHVIEAAQQEGGIRIGVVPSQGKSGWFGRVIAVAPKADLALIRLTERGSLPAATLFGGDVGDGGDVFAVGYPGNVDIAQGLNVGDIVSPTSPVKTRGSISAGRSSKSYETILHTAPIGSGNSGGPLLDPCGRVIGINTFGTVSGDGDSEFYFAVSAREALRFLRASGITPRTTGIPCRSLADLDRAEADRLAGEKVLSEEEARTADMKARDAADKAERAALFAVLAERDNRLALAGLALLLALAAVAGALVFRDRERLRDAKIAGGGAAVLVIAGLAAWLLRPGFDQVDARAKQPAATKSGAAVGIDPAKGGGALVCTIDLARSRVTVSDTPDVTLNWGKDGCVDGRDQFVLGASGWQRLTLGDDDSATVTHFDPAEGRYVAQRYFLDLDVAAELKGKLAAQPGPKCSGEAGARRLAEAQAPLAALLPAAPNERLAYNCRPAE